MLNAFIKIIDSYGTTRYVNPNEITMIEPVYYRGLLTDKWNVLMSNTSFQFSEKDYNVIDVLKAMVHQESLEKKKEPKEEHTEEPVFTYPDILIRYDFKYRTVKHPFMDEAEDFIMNERTCYFMDGDPLTAKAIKIPESFASDLI